MVPFQHISVLLVGKFPLYCPTCGNKPVPVRPAAAMTGLGFAAYLISDATFFGSGLAAYLALYSDAILLYYWQLDCFL